MVVSMVEFQDGQLHYYNFRGEKIGSFPGSVSLSEDLNPAPDNKPGVSPVNLRYGYVDKNLNWVIPPRFRKAGYFYYGAAEVEMEEGGYALINAEGQPINDFRAQESVFSPLSCTLAARVHRFGGNENEEWMVQIDGKVSRAEPLPPGITFSGAPYWNKPLLQIESARADGTRAYGAMDMDGRIVITPQYDELTPLANHFVIAKKESKVGLLDVNGKIIIPFSYRALSPLSAKHDLLFASPLGSEHVGIIDYRGRFVIPAKYSSYGFADIGAGLIGMRDGENWKFFNVQGKKYPPTPLVSSKDPFGLKSNPNSYLMGISFLTSASSGQLLFNPKERRLGAKKVGGFIDDQGRWFDGYPNDVSDNGRYVVGQFGVLDRTTWKIVVPNKYGKPTRKIDDHGVIIFDPLYKNKEGMTLVNAITGISTTFGDVWPLVESDGVPAIVHVDEYLNNGSRSIMAVEVTVNDRNPPQVVSGAEGCCIFIPKVYTPGRVMHIKWVFDPNPAEVHEFISKFRTDKEIYAAYEEHKSHYITHQVTLPYPEYKKAGDINLFFLPCDEVYVVIDEQEMSDLNGHYQIHNNVEKKWGIKKVCPKA